MRMALETLLTLQKEGLLQRFAIGGAIAAGACEIAELIALVQSHHLEERWERYVQRRT